MNVKTTIFVAACGLIILALGALPGCAPLSQKRPPQTSSTAPTEAPGTLRVTRITGWNSTVAQVGETWLNGAWVCNPINISGQVAHPFLLPGPTVVRSPPDEPVSFAGLKVASGQLPPGLTMESNGAISGTPTQQGRWNGELDTFIILRNLNYGEIPQQVHFIITGSQ